MTHGWGLVSSSRDCTRIGGRGADFLMTLCDWSSVSTSFKAWRSLSWVFIRSSNDGVSIFAEAGIIDWISSVLIWIGMAVDPKPDRALQVDLVLLLNNKPKDLW